MESELFLTKCMNVNDYYKRWSAIRDTDSDDDKISKIHYRKLELIEMIGIKEKPTNILYLYVEDSVLSSNILEDAKLIYEVRSKILLKISNIKKCL